MEVSALNANNIEDAFMKMVKNIYLKEDKETPIPKNKKLTLEN